MRNPFYFFRKNQKILLAVFGVMLMIAFTVGGAMMQFVPQPRVEDTEDRVVVRIGDEALSERRIRSMSRNMTLAMTVIAEAMRQTQLLQGEPNPPMPSLPGLIYQPGNQQRPAQIDIQPLSGRAMVQIYAYIKYAQDLGIVVDDEAVREFLLHTCNGHQSQYQYNSILEEMQAGDRVIVTYDNFFELVRDALTYQKLVALVAPASDTITPVSAWVGFRDLNRVVSAEMVPLSVDQFKDQVPPPTDAELKAFFERYRYDYPYAEMARPGFVESRKVAVAYVKADFDDFLEREMEGVSQEELEAYYERNRDNFRRPELPEEEPESEITDPEAPFEEEAPATEEPGETESPLPAEDPVTEVPATDEPAGDQPPAEQPEPQETEPLDPAEPAEFPPAEEPPAEEPPAEEPQSRIMTLDTGVQLVSFQDEDDPAPPEDPPPAQPQLEQPEPISDEVEPAPDQPSPEQPTTEEPVTEPPPAEEPLTDQLSPEQPSPTDQPRGEQPVTEEQPEPQYRPLEEVEEQVRREIAQPRAQQAMERAIQAIREPLQQDYEEYIYSDPDTRPETPHNMEEIQQIAEELGLSAGETPLMDIEKASRHELGEVFHFTFDPQTFRQIQMSLVQEIFQAQAPLFQVRTFPPLEPGRRVGQELYLYWRTAEAEGYVPTFEQARDRALEAWIHREAVKLAEEEARTLSLRVTDRESLQSLATQLGSEVLVAENVSYFNEFASPFAGPTPGSIPGIDDREVITPTRDALFGAGVGESFVAPTYGYETLYIGLVTDEQESAEELREQLLSGIQRELPPRVRNMIGARNSEAMQALNMDIGDHLDIRWQVAPEVLIDN